MPKGHVRWVDAPPPRTAPAKKPVFTCDDVEGEEWFARMPPAAQQETRDRVKAAEERGKTRELFVKSTRKRSMTQGAALFFVSETFCGMPSWGHSAAAIVVGAAVGALWHLVGAGRFRCAATSVLPYAFLRVAFASGSYLADSIFGVLGFVMIVALAAALGFDRERRRTDGLDY
jgi:hypothetical protein